VLEDEGEVRPERLIDCDLVEPGFAHPQPFGVAAFGHRVVRHHAAIRYDGAPPEASSAACVSA